MLYMFLADGFEETEAIATLDVIRRAGIDIKTVSISERTVKGSHGVVIFADILKEEIDFDGIAGIILPGGLPGTTNLQKDETVQRTIALCAERGLLIAAICAAPMILGEKGLLGGRSAVCYPGYEDCLKGAEVKSDFCVVDRNIITAKGAGVSMAFGAKIVDYFIEGEGGKILKTMQHA